jgi:hypothetical protein
MPGVPSGVGAVTCTSVDITSGGALLFRPLQSLPTQIQITGVDKLLLVRHLSEIIYSLSYLWVSPYRDQVCSKSHVTMSMPVSIAALSPELLRHIFVLARSPPQTEGACPEIARYMHVCRTWRVR